MKKTRFKAKQMITFANKQIVAVGKTIKKHQRPVMGAAVNALVVLAIASLPALAQGPNPFGGSGTSKLSSVGANLMVIGTWLAFFVGLLSFVLIPVFVKFEWDYKKLLVSGFTGLGGFVVIGSLAYDIVNLSSTTIADPTIGR